MSRVFYIKDPKVVNLTGADYFSIYPWKSNPTLGDLEIVRGGKSEKIRILRGDVLAVVLPPESNALHERRVSDFINNSLGEIAAGHLSICFN